MIAWFIHNLVCYIETACVLVINALIAAVALAIAAVMLLLPDMPVLPSMPSQVTSAFSWVAYWFPVDWLVGWFTTVLAIWLVYLVAAIPLRYFRAVKADV